MPENIDIIMIIRNTAKVMPTKRAINLLLSLTRSFNAILRIPDTCVHLLLFPNIIRVYQTLTATSYYKFIICVNQADCMFCFSVTLTVLLTLTIIVFFSCAGISTFFQGRAFFKKESWSLAMDGGAE